MPEPDAARLTELETLVVRIVVVATTSVLALGQLAPFVTAPVDAYDDAGDDDERSSLLSFGFNLISDRTSEGDVDRFAVAAGIGFIGLAAVTAVLIGLLVTVVWNRAATDRHRTAALAATVLAIVGAAAALILAVAGRSSEEEWQLHSGIVAFGVGLALTCAVLSPRLARLWIRTSGQPAYQDPAYWPATDPGCSRATAHRNTYPDGSYGTVATTPRS